MKIKKIINYFNMSIQDIIFYIHQTNTTTSVIALTMFSIIIAVFNIISSFFYGKLMNTALSTSLTSLLLRILLIYGITKSFMIFFQFLTSLMSGRLRQQLILKMRDKTFTSLLRMDYESFQKKNIGDLLGKLQEKTFNLADNLGLFLPDLIRRLLVSLFSIIALFIIHPGLSFIFLLLLLPMFYFQIAGGYYCESLMNTLMKAMNDRNSLYYDLVIHDKMIQILEMDSYVSKWISKKINLVISSLTKAMAFNTAIFSPAKIMNQLILIIPCMIGCIWVQKNQMTLQEFITAISLISIISSEITSLDSIFANMPTILSNGNDLKEIWNAPNEKEGFINYVDYHKTPIIIENCSFSYQSKDSQLLNLNLSIQKGEKIAIVGKNGSGKSTLLKILSGLYKSYEGHVYVFGKDIRDISKSVISDTIGYVSQDIQLFQDTLLNNLIPDKEEVSIDALYSLMESMNLTRLIPLLNSTVDEFESNISGGEKQRLLLIRILLGNPRLLLLDEVTSALDQETERLLQDYILSLSELTVVSVLHKLYLTKKYDKILVTKEGTIQESGTFDELLKKRGAFYQMYMGMEAEV